VLISQSPTRDMNPSVPQRVIDAALEEDQPRALVEWFAQFRSDVESFVKREAVEVCGARLLAGEAPDHLQHPYSSQPD
jgi:hypothetical protein